MDGHHLGVAALGQGGHHLLSNFAGAYLGAGFHNGARDVPAQYQGQRGAGSGAAIAPLAPEQIATVHRGRLDAQQHLAGSGLWIGDVLVSEYVLAAQLVNYRGFHWLPPLANRSRSTLLVELAHSSLGYLVDEHHIVGQPPAGELAFQVGQHGVAVKRAPLLRDRHHAG